MTREELECTLTRARSYGGFGLDHFFTSILAHDQQQRDLITTLTGRYDQEIACNADRAEEIQRLHRVIEATIDELYNYYDGAEDSGTRWMGEILYKLEQAKTGKRG